MVLLSTEVLHPNLRNEPHIFYSIIQYLGYNNPFIILIEFVIGTFCTRMAKERRNE
jgi:hypothetical protein